MGRIYYHGIVVPETIASLSPEYPLRGWVQQEISFTNVMYHIKPLYDWSIENSDVYEKCLQLNQAGQSIQPAWDDLKDKLSFNRAVNESWPYFNAITRICEGRSSPEAAVLQSNVSHLVTKLQKYLVMYGSVMSETLKVILDLDLSFSGQLRREAVPEGLIASAIQSFRSGMFTYDTDRNVASFQLAQYVLNIDSANLNDTLDSFVPSFHRQYLTINANPGRWCTGLGPIKPLQTLTWKYAVENTSLAGTVPFGMDSVQQLLNRQHLDNFAVILLKTTVEALSRYEYVIGFELVGDGKFWSVHIGLAPVDEADVDQFVRGIVSTNVPVTENPSPGTLMNSFLKMEFGNRALAILNSHRRVYDDPSLRFPVTSNNLRMLDMLGCPPFGEFFGSIKVSIRVMLHMLGCAATMCANAEAYPEDKRLWGYDGYNHVTI